MNSEQNPPETNHALTNEFAMLWDADEQIPENAIRLAERDDPFTDREQRVFQPIETTEVASSHDFSNMFGDESQGDQTDQDMIEAAAVRQNKRTETTEVSLQSAASKLGAALARDQQLENIIDGSFDQPAPLSDKVAALRTNPQLRLRVGRYLSDKLEQVHYLPERVARNASNNLKNPNFPGYDKLTSREYVAVLALSKIDGTFRVDRETDQPEKNQYGEVVTGQHRFAADMLLDTDAYLPE